MGSYFQTLPERLEVGVQDANANKGREREGGVVSLEAAGKSSLREMALSCQQTQEGQNVELRL